MSSNKKINLHDKMAQADDVFLYSGDEHPYGLPFTKPKADEKKENINLSKTDILILRDALLHEGTRLNQDRRGLSWYDQIWDLIYKLEAILTD